MDMKSAITTTNWHIPRPSLSSSSTGSINDPRSQRGSASSQGSSSNHSTHSVSSGSLLLSAANLARMDGRDLSHSSYINQNKEANLIFECRKSPLTSAVITIPEETRDVSDAYWSDVKRGSIPEQDTTSRASSTHFTVVNGFTKHRTNKEPKTCCCDHSHQITVLVIFMTILLSVCILAAVCFVEMRMRRETGMYKYS
ncbi:uncharacterized protein LOC119831119 [Zerene cesonia]|uniref:uncharacterized protein LOC119831119 n=1 Tax=Zerene cesonia TaxID=33412 RepID=UPI0018E53966|nr:uncharacterized protein LOC119831119 [Zerene cesonia]